MEQHFNSIVEVRVSTEVCRSLKLRHLSTVACSCRRITHPACQQLSFVLTAVSDCYPRSSFRSLSCLFSLDLVESCRQLHGVDLSRALIVKRQASRHIAEPGRMASQDSQALLTIFSSSRSLASNRESRCSSSASFHMPPPT